MTNHLLGFILSKMNLLIFVTAMFAIVTFFSYGLSDISKVNEANFFLSHLTNVSEVVSNSDSSCDATSYSLPAALKPGGGNFYYTLKVSRAITPVSGGGTVNTVIFSVFPRADQMNVFAASSFRTSAEVKIFKQDYDELKRLYTSEEYASECDAGVSVCSAVADPQAKKRVNTIVFIKERQGEKDVLYIIPCNSDLCESIITEKIGSDTGLLGRDFSCGTTLS